MTALNSDCRSGVNGKPAVSNTRLLRPGTVARLFAKSRTAHNMLRAPKSASALISGGAPSEATSPFGDTVANFVPATTFFNRSASAVKFCVIRSVPPKSAIAICRFRPALSSINFAAACRAAACSPNSIVELSKNNTR
jgi:hypothetical protein